MEAKINAVAGQSSEFNGEWSRGFKVDGNDNWFNIYGANKEQVDKYFTDDLVSKGNTVILVTDEEDKGRVHKVDLVKKGSTEDKKPFGDSDDFEDYKSLTDKMQTLYGNGYNVVTECIDDVVKMENGHAFKCTVTIPNFVSEKDMIAFDRVIVAHGDATKENTNGVIQKHIFRMAETRSIVRAFRVATASTKSAKEEHSE